MSQAFPIFHIHIVDIDQYWQIVEPYDPNYQNLLESHGLILNCNEDRYSEESIEFIASLRFSNFFPFPVAHFISSPMNIVVTDSGI